MVRNNTLTRKTDVRLHLLHLRVRLHLTACLQHRHIRIGPPAHQIRQRRLSGRQWQRFVRPDADRPADSGFGAGHRGPVTGI